MTIYYQYSRALAVEINISKKKKKKKFKNSKKKWCFFHFFFVLFLPVVFNFGRQACVEILHILHRRVTRRWGVNEGIRGYRRDTRTRDLCRGDYYGQSWKSGSPLRRERGYPVFDFFFFLGPIFWSILVMLMAHALKQVQLNKYCSCCWQTSTIFFHFLTVL